MENLNLIIPEIFVSITIMFLLVLGVFKKNSFGLIHNLSLMVLLITSVIVFNETINIQETYLFNNSIIIDYLSSFMKIITLLAAFIVLSSVISPSSSKAVAKIACCKPVNITF